MKKIVLTIALGLLVGFATPNSARADTVLIQEFDTTANWITLVTAVDTYGQNVHWMYRYDNPLVAGNTCTHFDGVGTTTPNDVFTTNIGAGGAVLFGDTTSTAVGIPAGNKGFITLYNYGGAYTQGTPAASGFGAFSGPEHTISASAIQANVLTGTVFTLKGANDPYGIGEGNLDDMAYGADFSNVNATPAGSLDPNQAAPRAVWFPQPTAGVGGVSTSWEIIVAHMNMSWATPGLVATAANASETVALGDANGFPFLTYDINEGAWSGGTEVQIDCFLKVSLTDLLPPANIAQVQNGGWANFVITSRNVANLTANTGWHKGILVYKEETTMLLGGAAKSAITSANRIDY